MKGLLFDLVVSVLVSALPADVQPLARPVVKKALGWVVEGVAIWARSVRRDLEG